MTDNAGSQTASQRKFETVFEHANDAIFIVDIENDQIVSCNSAAEELVEYSREELRSMPASDLHPHNLDQFMAFADSVIEEGDGWTDQITCYCKSGDIIPAEMSASVVELDGRPHLVNHIRDTTDRKEREWFEALIEHSSDLITVVKPDGTIRYQSPSVDHILGYTPDELRDESFIEYVHPDDRPDIEGMFDQLRDHTGVVTGRVEYRFRQADGSWAWLESIGSHRPDSPITGYLVNSREITSRKESQQQAAVLHRMVRHNLRNELTVILAQAEALAESDREGVAMPAEQIREHASNLTEMTAHVSVLSDMLGSHRAQQHRHEIPDIVDYLVTQLRRDNPDVEFECDLPAEQAVFAVSKFDIALEHVLDNAVEHNDATDPRVSITVIPPRSEADTVDIVIADNGPGIPDQEQTALLEGEETPLAHGSGLGLWIVNWIITRSGGRIAFEENEPRGSRVIISLPPADSQ